MGIDVVVCTMGIYKDLDLETMFDLLYFLPLAGIENSHIVSPQGCTLLQCSFYPGHEFGVT